MEQLKPSSRYRIRLFVLVSIAAVLLLGVGSFTAWMLSLDWAHAVRVNRALQVYLLAVLMGYALSLILAHHYYRSMVYELAPDEIRLRRGVWVHSVQHIPLRCIAAVTVKRDFFDRCLEIGTLEFAFCPPMAGQFCAARMVGLPDVGAQHRRMFDVLQQYWGDDAQHPGVNQDQSQVVLASPAVHLR